MLEQLLRIGEVYKPWQRLTVDEARRAFKGQFACPVYNPKKPVKHGFEIHALCKASTGVLIAFEVYAGHKTPE